MPPNRGARPGRGGSPRSVAGLADREALVAPVGGVLAASNAVVGQVVEPRLIFEVIDPDSLHVGRPPSIRYRSTRWRQRRCWLASRIVPLSYVGAPRRLREQALP